MWLGEIEAQADERDNHKDEMGDEAPSEPGFVDSVHLLRVTLSDYDSHGIGSSNHFLLGCSCRVQVSDYPTGLRVRVLISIDA